MIEEDYYTIGLGILFIFELFFGIPLMVDLIQGTEWFNILFYLMVGHVILILVGTGLRLSNYRVSIHILGIFAFFISVIPYISFTLHLVVSWLIMKCILNDIKKFKKD